MATEMMFDLAFRYRKTMLWQRIHDDEVFAVQLSDGQVGYCTVKGMMGDHIALAVYVGPRGYLSLRKLADSVDGEPDRLTMNELFTSQDFLQCSFERRDMLSDLELDEARRYARDRGMSLRGRNAFPKFTKFCPGRFPWSFDSEADEVRICDALSAAIALREILRVRKKYELGLSLFMENASLIPMLCPNGDTWIVRFVRPPEVEEEFAEPEYKNDILAARLRRAAKKDTWECGTVHVPEPVTDVDDGDAAPFFPLVLFAADRRSGYLMSPVLGRGGDEARMVNDFASAVLSRSCPRRILAGDDRCYHLLRDLCAKAGILLTREDGLPALDGAVRDLLSRQEDTEAEEDEDPDEVNDLFRSLMAMSDAELRQLPDPMARLLLDLTDRGAVPRALANRLERQLKR